MGISKTRAIELIEQKIQQFKEVRDKTNLNNIFGTDYGRAYYGSETLLIELFSEKEKDNFRHSVSTHFGLSNDPSRRMIGYIDHINRCITQLEVYKERVENYWSNEPDFNNQKEPDTINDRRNKQGTVNYYADQLHIGDRIHTSVGDISNNGQLFIGKINNVVANLNNSGETELAQVLKTLTNAIVASRDLTDDKKEEQVQIVSQIAEEATKPKPNKTMLQILINGLVSTLKVIPDVADAITKVEPLLANLHLRL